MAEESNTNPDNKPGEIPTPIPSVVEQQPDQVKEEKKEAPATNKNEDTQRSYPHPTIIIEKDKGWTKQDYISITAILFTAALFIVTLITFYQTKRAVDISEKALMDARIKDSIADERTKQAFALSKQDFEARNIKDSLNRDLSKQSLEAQINSVNGTQKQFEISNEPILEIDSMNIHLEIGQPLSITYQIKNLNKYTAKVLGAGELIGTKYNVPNLNSIKSEIKDIANNTKYISDTYPIHLEFTESPKIYNDTRSEFFKSGKFYIYFGTIIVYENIVTGRKKLYKFLLRMKNDSSYEYLINENVYLENEKIKPAFAFKR